MQEQQAPTPETPEASKKPRRRLNKRTRQVLAVLRQLRAGSSIALSCRAAGITPWTFWNWRRKEPRIEALADMMIISRISLVEDSLFAACLERNMTAIIFFLTNRAGEKWADRRALVNNTNVFNAKAEASQNGKTDTVESVLKRIDLLRTDLVPPSDSK